MNTVLAVGLARTLASPLPLSRDGSGFGRATRPSDLRAVFGVGLLGIVGVISGFDFPPVLLDGLRLGAFAIAAYEYERTWSIWVPILVVAVFLAVDVAAFAESVTTFGGPV